MILELCCIAVALPIIYFMATYIYHVIQLRKYPSGPFPIPVIGNLHLLGDKPFEALRDLGKVYGNVFSISFGMERVVIVNTIEPAKEALITKGTHFAGRCKTYTIEYLTRGFKDIIFCDYGKQWIFLRKLAHSSLRIYGDGMERLENLIIQESDALNKRLLEVNDNPVSVHSQIGISLINVICYMVFGHRYDIEDEEFIQALKMSQMFTSGLDNCDPVAFLPWLRFFPLKNQVILRQAASLRDSLFRKKLNEHKATFNSANIRDITDALLDSSNQTDPLANHVMEVTDDHIEMVISDIFLAGYETTLTTLQWVFLYLLHHPEYLDKVYKEIIGNVGHNRKPELKDKSNLPFVQATIQETLRLSSLVPLGVPHKAVQESSIDGKVIRNGTQILFNIWNFHHDERHWDNPNEFNPYRWLDNEGKYTPGKHVSYLPFSAGRRVCLGEQLAKTELFLIFSRLMHEFEVLPNPAEPFPSMEGNVSITLSPHSYTAIFRPRNT